MAQANFTQLPSSPKSPTRLIDTEIAPSPSKSTRKSRDLDDDTLNEQSPLLQPTRPFEDDQDSNKSLLPSGDSPEWIGNEHDKKSSWYMLLLTMGGFG
jgi:hypothetical protein